MKFRFKDRIQSQYLKSVSVLMSGTIVAQILAFLTSMLMTRLFSEEAIGEYTLLLTAVSMFGGVICGRYDMSIVTEKSTKGVYALIKLCFLITISLSILLGVGYTSYIALSEKININIFSFMIWTVILLLLTGVGNIANAFNNKSKEYKLLSKVTIIREIIRDVILISTGFFKVGVIGLIVSHILSLCACLKIQFKKLLTQKACIISVSTKELLLCAKRNRNQPLYSVPSLFINSFSYSILNLFIGSMYGMTNLAFYSISYRVLGLPLALLSTNVSRVFYERAASDYNRGSNFTAIFLKSSILLFGLGFPIMLVLYFFSPVIFGILYGEGWEISGEIITCLIPMFFVKLIVSALSPSMIIVNKQRVDMFLQALFIICILGSRYLASGVNDMFIFLKYINISFTIVYLLYYLIMLLYSRNLGKTKITKV